MLLIKGLGELVFCSPFETNVMCNYFFKRGTSLDWATPTKLGARYLIAENHFHMGLSWHFWSFDCTVLLVLE